MDAATRQRICQLVAGLVIADDILDDKEEAFLDRLIATFGIEGGRDVVFPLVDRDDAANQIKQLDRSAQEEALRLLIEAACVDGQIQLEERDYLDAIAKALELSDADLEKRIATGLKR